MPVLPKSCLMLLSMALLAGAASSGHAQNAYRCQDNGRVVFSDKPCPGGSVVDTRPATGGGRAAAATAAAGQAAAPNPTADSPKAAAAAPRAVPGAPGPGYQTREQACAEGSQKACDEIACLRDESDACARIGGSVRGSGWYEVSRKRETRPGKNDRGQTTLHRVLVLTIKCSGQPPRSGDIAIGRGSVTIARSTVNYSSVDTAAAALCKR